VPWPKPRIARVGQNHTLYGIFGRETTKYTVIYGVYIQFWPTLRITGRSSCLHEGCLLDGRLPILWSLPLHTAEKRQGGQAKAASLWSLSIPSVFATHTVITQRGKAAYAKVCKQQLTQHAASLSLLHTFATVQRGAVL